MANPTFYQGRNLVVTWDGIPVGCSKTATFELNTAVSDSTTKCDNVGGVLWSHGSPQKNDWKITDNGLVPIQTSAGEATEHSLMFFVRAQAQQVKGYATWEDPAGILVGGDVWVTSTKSSAAVDSETTYDVTLTGDGPLNFIAVS